MWKTMLNMGTEKTSFLCKGNYHCMEWFGFDQTSIYVVNSIKTPRFTDGTILQPLKQVSLTIFGFFYYNDQS